MIAGRDYGRNRPNVIRRVKKAGGSGSGAGAEGRDEKLDLQICPDYYEIARLPGSWVLKWALAIG